jgi:hypothetical protein
MSRTIRNTAHSAAASFSRIEFIPSGRAGAAWVVWLIVAAAVVQLSGLPPLWKALIAASVSGAGGITLWRYVFLRGSRALRALEWSAGEASYYVCLGGTHRRLRAVPEDCRRYGILWLLRFRTAEGLVQMLLDARCQDARALRRLARGLFHESASAEGSVRAAGSRGPDTIRPKV